MPLYLSVLRSVKGSGSQLGKFYPWDNWQCLKTFLVIIPERIFTGTAQECYEHLQYNSDTHRVKNYLAQYVNSDTFVKP